MYIHIYYYMYNTYNTYFTYNIHDTYNSMYSKRYLHTIYLHIIYLHIVYIYISSIATTAGLILQQMFYVLQSPLQKRFNNFGPRVRS